MYVIKSPSVDPYFNLALEEYLFSKEEQYLLIWRSNESVVIGKHQNVYEEVNIEYAKRHDIPILRRLSGGGTVYHDIENINISFLGNQKQLNGEFHSYSEMIQTFLHTLDIPSTVNNRGDLLLNSKKISGCAQYLKKGRLLHHATLLVDSDLRVLREVLNVSTEIISNSSKSVRSEVTSVGSEIGEHITCTKLMSSYVEYLITEGYEKKELSQRDVDQVLLLKKRYEDWEWTYGKTPKFKIKRIYQNSEIILTVKKGHVVEIESDIDLSDIINKKYSRNELQHVIQSELLLDALID